MIERKRKITIFLAQKHRKNSFSENFIFVFRKNDLYLSSKSNNKFGDVLKSMKPEIDVKKCQIKCF